MNTISGIWLSVTCDKAISSFWHEPLLRPQHIAHTCCNAFYTITIQGYHPTNPVSKIGDAIRSLKHHGHSIFATLDTNDLEILNGPGPRTDQKKILSVHRL